MPDVVRARVDQLEQGARDAISLAAAQDLMQQADRLRSAQFHRAGALSFPLPRN